MFEWIISSGILIIIIVALRHVLKGKVSLRLQYALWGLVLLRLLVPFSIGNSSISVMNVADKIAEQSAWQPEIISEQGKEQENEAEVIPSEVVNNHGEILPSEKTEVSDSNREEIRQPEENKKPVYDSSRYDKVEYKSSDKDVTKPIEDNKQEIMVTDATSAPVAGEETPDLTEALTLAEVIVYAKKVALYFWIGGMVLAGSYLVFVNVRFSVLLRKNRRLLEHIEGYRLPVYVAENIDTPCMYGFVRPTIYVTPEVTKSEKVLKHVLEHESTHYRHADHIWCVLRGIALALHWYNPLVWLAAVLSRNDSELACDEGTIKRIGEDERADYGRTLIEMTCQKHSALFVNATTMTGSKKSIKERIVLIAKKPKMAIYTLVAVVVIAAIAVGCTFTGAGKDVPASQTGEENSSDENETTRGEEEPTTEEQPTTPEEQLTTSGDEKETTGKEDASDETEGTVGSVKWRLEGDTIIFSGTGELLKGSWTNKVFKHVVIEDGITELDWFAFSQNENIESLIIPGSVEIAVGFANCKNLKSITLAEGIKIIEEYAFTECAIEKIVIPDSVTYIGSSAFAMCENLKEIEYNGILERCGSFVFEDTPWLENKQKEYPLVILSNTLVDASEAMGEVVVPNGITLIGDYAFFKNESVTSVIMPEGIKSIGWRAFNDVALLKKLTFKGSIETIANEAFIGCDSLTEIVFPEGMVSIGYEAFAVCNSLEKVVFPESLKELGVRAFLGCDKLIDVVIPESFTGFGGDDFAGTAWLEAKKKENPIVVVNGVLIDATGVEGSLVIPEGVTHIASYACYESKYITDVIIPEGVTHIDSCAFSGCHLLASVTVPESVSYIDEHTAFGAYKKPIVIYGKKGSYAEKYVKNYYLEGELTFEPVFDYTWRLERDTVIISGTGKLEEGAWRNAVFKNVIIEEGIKEIGAFAFSNCEKLESVVIPSTVKTVIGFDGCKNLRSVTFTKGIEFIDECAFERCTALEKIVIPDSVKSIELWAFAGCAALEEVVLEGAIHGINAGAFEGTPWLEKSQKDNPIVILGNVLVDASKATGEVIVPEGVEVIGEFAFSGNGEDTGVTSVVLPKSLKAISWRAFYGNDTLEKVTFLGSVETIDTDAFVDCDSLKEIVFPEGLVSIGTEAFLGCGSLERVVFPRSLKTIGTRAFEQCMSLKEIIIPEDITGFDGHAFLNTEWLANKQKENPVVVVNGVLIDAYSAAGTVVIPDGVTRIAEFAGAYASKVTDLIIPEGVIGIGDFAFDTCIALKSITIPKSVTNIEYAFEYCNNLRVIYGEKGSYAENYAKEKGIAFKTSDDKKTTVLEQKLYDLYKSEDGVTISLYKGENKYNTYTITHGRATCEKVAINELNKLKEYKWTQSDSIEIKDSEYRIVIAPCTGSGSITVYQGGAGMISCDDGKNVTYWTAEGSGPWESYAEDVHRVYDVYNLLEVYNTPFYFEGSAEAAAEYFVGTFFGERLMNLAPDNAFSIADYDVESWWISKSGKAGDKIKGGFYYAFSYEGASEYSTEDSAFYGNGEYAGKYLIRKFFGIEKQANNYWRFWFEYMVG